MSARNIGISTLQQVTVEARQTRLTLSPEAVVIHRGGIEFRTANPFPLWVEMTVTLQSRQGGSRVNCSGVVIACTGNKHMGYHVSMVFTGLTRQAASRLTSLAGAQRL